MQIDLLHVDESIIFRELYLWLFEHQYFHSLNLYKCDKNILANLVSEKLLRT